MAKRKLSYRDAIDRMVAALPPITKPEDVETLPWAGNAAWDVPIMNHVDAYGRDDRFPEADRKRAVERAGFLMTGENCDFTDEYTFADYLQEEKVA